MNMCCFQLHIWKLCVGECDSVSAELKEAQKAGAELMQDREELSAQLAGLEQQLADMTQAHNDLKWAPFSCGFVDNRVLTLKTAACMLCYDPPGGFASLCAAQGSSFELLLLFWD